MKKFFLLGAIGLVLVLPSLAGSFPRIPIGGYTLGDTIGEFKGGRHPGEFAGFGFIFTTVQTNGLGLVRYLGGQYTNRTSKVEAEIFVEKLAKAISAKYEVKLSECRSGWGAKAFCYTSGNASFTIDATKCVSDGVETYEVCFWAVDYSKSMSDEKSLIGSNIVYRVDLDREQREYVINPLLKKARLMAADEAKAEVADGRVMFGGYGFCEDISHCLSGYSSENPLPVLEVTGDGRVSYVNKFRWPDGRLPLRVKVRDDAFSLKALGLCPIERMMFARFARLSGRAFEFCFRARYSETNVGTERKSMIIKEVAKQLKNVMPSLSLESELEDQATYTNCQYTVWVGVAMSATCERVNLGRYANIEPKTLVVSAYVESAANFRLASKEEQIAKRLANEANVNDHRSEIEIIKRCRKLQELRARGHFSGVKK